MAGIIILNGSPRAPKSNSKRYSEIFARNFKFNSDYYNITKSNHLELCQKLNDFSDLLFVFPLYADGIPVTLLNFLKTLEQNPPSKKPVISILVNCGFLEYQQNDIAVKMIKLFCTQNHYRFGSVLKIGGGEAILDSPFKFLILRKIKQLAASIGKSRYRILHTTMPISPQMFIKASTTYWVKYGSKNGITKAEMETMKIEGQ